MTEQEYQARLKRDQLLLEQAATLQRLQAQGLGLGAGGITPNNWITVTDTAYLYPMVNIEAALADTELTITRRGGYFTFESLVDIDTFWYEMWEKTSFSNPANNPGYSLGVGTRLTGSVNTIYFMLESGQPIAILQEVTQTTDQDSLPQGVGGDSPQGTVGYIPVWVDFNGDGVPGTVTDLVSGNTDPLRIVKV
jgi:hypothetical protein